MSQTEATPIPPPNHDQNQPMIIANPDGTYTRLLQVPNIPATPDPSATTSPVLTKDILINSTTQTWLRIYLPRTAPPDDSSSTKLPLIVYYHGGGFIFLSAASSFIHDFCLLMAAQINAVVVSVDYRLAPEHRLPAAYEDAIEALHCIKTSEENWLTQFTDLSNCFLMGTSAGGNIAYHAALMATEQVQKLKPLNIKGLILHHPYFGGLERTESELKMVKDPILPLSGNDLMWELSLPVGADRDHEYSNPMDGYGLNSKMGELNRVLVMGGYDDPLIDRQMEFVKLLEKKGAGIVTHFGEGCHSVELLDSSKAFSLFQVVKDFMFN